METLENLTGAMLVKPYTLDELAKLYGCSQSKLRTKLKPIRKKIGHVTGTYFNTHQVRTICKHLGYPIALSYEVNTKSIMVRRMEITILYLTVIHQLIKGPLGQGGYNA